MPIEKFKNKYRIQSHRKPNWDYSADGHYFLTIVTQNRECNLGKIVNTELETHGRVSPPPQSNMILSDFGKIVETEWYKSFEIRNELILHDFVLMPNHLHTIVQIDSRVETHGVETHGVETHGVETHGVETHRLYTHGRVSLHIQPQPQSTTNTNIEISQIKRNPPIRLPQSISSFIAGFKSAVNTKIDDYIDEHHLSLPKYNRNNHFFQPNYHDHIIRNNYEYQTISNYIANNPMNWNNDKFCGFTAAEL